MKCESSLSKYPPHPHMRPNSNPRGDHLVMWSSITPDFDLVKANTFICVITWWFSLCKKGDKPLILLENFLLPLNNILWISS